MNPSHAILLFDDGHGDLGPLSDLRASFEQRTGGFTMLERARTVTASVHVACGPALAAAVTERHGTPEPGISRSVLCLNGRLHAPLAGGAMASAFGLAVGHALLSQDGAILAAHLDAGAAGAFAAAVSAGRPALPAGCAAAPCDIPAWSRPWHLLDAHRLGGLLAADAEHVLAAWRASGELGALPAHAACTGPEAVHVHASASIGIGVVFDTSAGPVCVCAGAQVGHGSVVQGPAWIGPRSIVAPGALLKERAVLGPQCRAAGEIGSAIFQACSNKAHDGHLGDALLGEWVNLGAGTVNSNLLNTYGEVTMRLRPGASMERTGRQFMGCVIGDHAKTAIGTRIMTGSSIGTGAMWAAGRAVSGAVAPFAWVTDDGERRFRLDKFQEIARTVMARRGAEPGPATVARLAALHAAAGG